MISLLTISEKNKNNKNHNKFDRGEEFTIIERVKLLYSRLSGSSFISFFFVVN